MGYIHIPEVTTMSKSKKVWIPAAIALLAAVILVVFIAFTLLLGESSAHDFRKGGVAGMPPGGGQRPERGEGGALEGYFSTFGTIALFVGAASFWFWFKKKAEVAVDACKAGRKTVLFRSISSLAGERSP